MLRLKNIVLAGDLISADMYYEDHDYGDRIVVDWKKREIVELENKEFYEFTTAPGHAWRALLEVAESGSIPKERLIMWY